MTRFTTAFPWLSLCQAFWIARIATAGFFMAHAIGRIVLGTIPRFAQFLDGLGFPAALAIVWAITVVELVAGLMIIARWQVRIAVVPLLAIAVGGIVLIHARAGWFVGEHGVGGSEYSVALIVLLLLIAGEDAERHKP